MLSAKKSGIPIRAMSEKRISLPYKRTLNKKEFEKVKKGYVPMEMEDKWYVEFVDGKLEIFKARTGECIYTVGFIEDGEGNFQTVDSWVACEPKEFSGGEDPDYEILMINIVIDDFILRSEDDC